MSDISLYYGLNPYYSNTNTNANGKIRNLVWEELVDPVGGKLLAMNPLVFFHGKSIKKCSAYCLTVTSSKDASCHWDGQYIANDWAGGDLTLYHNHVQIGTLPYGFTNLQFCLPAENVDRVNDQFKIINGGTNAVS